MTETGEADGPIAPRRGPRRRPVPHIPPPVRRILWTVAAAYLTALLVLNLSTTAMLGGFVNRIFPRFGAETVDTSALAAMWQTIQARYVIRDVPASTGTAGAEQGMVQALRDAYHDRFSAYLTAAQYRQLTAQLGGRRDGSIGITLEARCGEAVCGSGQTPTDAVIEDVLTGQPADRAGIRSGDFLVAVNGVTLASLAKDIATEVNRSAPMVRGPVGTAVRLTLRRAGRLIDVSVQRANLRIPSVFSRMMGSTLYLQVTGFDTDTGATAKQQLREGLAAGARAVVLDLRHNGGGYVSAAQSLVSEFVQPSAAHRYVVLRKGRLAPDGSVGSAQLETDDPILSGGVAYGVRLVVLVDGESASASEITTAALRDDGRATVVGEKTFGKGSVQVDFPLPGGADLHLTVERWFGPRGESIEGTGITPDTTVALSNPEARFRLDAQSPAAAGDAQLQAALQAALRETSPAP